MVIDHVICMTNGFDQLGAISMVYITKPTFHHVKFTPIHTTMAEDCFKFRSSAKLLFAAHERL